MTRQWHIYVTPVQTHRKVSIFQGFPSSFFFFVFVNASCSLGNQCRRVQVVNIAVYCLHEYLKIDLCIKVI